MDSVSRRLARRPHGRLPPSPRDLFVQVLGPWLDFMAGDFIGQNCLGEALLYAETLTPGWLSMVCLCLASHAALHTHNTDGAPLGTASTGTD